MDNIASSVKGLDRGAARPKRRILATVIKLLVAVIIVALAAMAFWPAPSDFHGDPSTAGVGPGHGGLERPFPAMIAPADNTTSNPHSKERIELGRLLFFDPVLSHDNSVSCAVCHHPDLGFTDMRGQSMGIGGKGLGPERTGGTVLRRGAPSLWNACFNFKQFWDGRADTLEQQADGPITNADEMGSSADEVGKKLKAIPEYVKMFDGAFGGSGGSAVTMQNAEEAVAAFERTLISNDSPFDRFAKGDLDALSAQQRRGFNLFRSGKTRCFECHGMPAFANPDFKIVGVPDVDANKPDYGRSEIAGGDGYKRAFKVPTLRNVALTAPYMHNGRFKTLEDVVDFYSHGGGPGMGLKDVRVDDKIRPYDLTVQERDDIVAFLCSLTDESKKPVFPDRVPSELPVVPHVANPGAALVAKY
ncbi:MAG: cytochrome-c peroxidase, partial [Blastocatellia bacterium]